MMAKKLQKNDLGLGIRALLKGVDEASPAEQAEVVRTLAHSVAMIPVKEIEVNPYQPRKDFDQEALEELSTSLKTYGLIQPVTVRRLSEGAYQLISGERRFRAAKLAGLTDIPAYVRLANDQEMLEMALVENIQREELNAIEVAISYQRLIDECQLTHEKMSERVGKQRSTITNHLRLLKLPPDIQSAIKDKKLSMGHARALAGIQDYATMDLLFKKTISEDLSVRALEALIRNYSPTRTQKQPSGEGVPDAYKKVEQSFKSFFGSGKLKIKLSGNHKGQILIPFDSVDELNSLLDRIET
jgi:ParB family transcriptional regulator, chromosome partitioning protein